MSKPNPTHDISTYAAYLVVLNNLMFSTEGCLQMRERVSSGIEPAHPKRQHLTPMQLQQRLSHLVGKQLGPKEMSQIIPNFPDLLGEFHNSGQAPNNLQTIRKEKYELCT